MDYALYRGDDLIIIGTLEDLAKEMGIKVASVKWYMSNSYQKRMDKMKNKDNAVIIFQIDDEEEMMQC